jgi:hypothetical protein
MKNDDDREISRELKALGGQIPVPSASLRARRGSIRKAFVAIAVAVAAVILAVALGSAITRLRSSQENPASATGVSSSSPTASATAVTATATPSPSVALVAFPDVTLVAGTSDGMVYRISGGTVVGSPVRACPGGTGTVLALHPAPSGQSVLVVCGGTTTGVAVLVDIPGMTVRSVSQPVIPRDDVAAWAPDERSIALIQPGKCDPPSVCSVHVSLWDLASGTTRVVRPDEPLTMNLRWTSAGLSVSIPQGGPPLQGTFVWDGQAWTSYSPHRLWIVDASGNALLVEAPTGSIGGRVWKRVAGQEQFLTVGASVEWPLGLDGDRSIVARDQPPGVSVVTYRAGQAELVVPAPGFCLAAQPWDRWLICTTIGSAALAYSLDSNAFARQQIAGLGSFTALAALPKK